MINVYVCVRVCEYISGWDTPPTLTHSLKWLEDNDTVFGSENESIVGLSVGRIPQSRVLRLLRAPSELRFMEEHKDS